MKTLKRTVLLFLFSTLIIEKPVQFQKEKKKTNFRHIRKSYRIAYICFYVTHIEKNKKTAPKNKQNNNKTDQQDGKWHIVNDHRRTRDDTIFAIDFSHFVLITFLLSAFCAFYKFFPKKNRNQQFFLFFFPTDFHSIEYDRQMLKHTSMAVGRFKCEWHSFEQAFLYLSNILKIRKNYSNYVKREKREFHGKLFNLFNCSSYFSTVTVGCMDKKTHTFWAKKCHFNLLFFYEYIGTGQKNSTY